MFNLTLMNALSLLVKFCVNPLAPTLSRDRRHHTIKVPVAGEGAVRSEIEKSVLNSRLNIV
jgi:hypothetical protein